MSSTKTQAKPHLLACALEEAMANEKQGRPGAGQDPAKRQQILEGADRVFSQMGFDAASMNDITREAGVSKGTIYVYFDSKEELFMELCIQYRDKFFSGVHSALEGERDIREALIAFGMALSMKVTSDVVIRAQRVVIGVAERMPSLSRSFYEQGPKRGQALVRGWLEKRVAAGDLEIDDLDLATYQLSDLMVSGIFKRRLFGCMDDPPSDEVVRKTVTSGVDMFLKAYRKR
ncbi:TetR/AcrR family transcriptional regulator [Phyllobacterium sp. 21LDTY02-6]|jgi:AcrR family transcriptional regulator|uniref:TetR/AcrR family transcriptional regulator n=1 Tax=unclassified Phyllobacterium TaxID=2638441 RepID=UPI002020DE4B|nr:MULTISPECIES: TetR/AcrR family transcriptional regulator [unclassified Phyllobacterium]MCO4315706.1 TetR/AcrR family transcriptional regulator [Phyllobacterium sp. 21LDTY02-6]MCX8280882.1 TetR/AcrR family transcriptional regulator [Phyllobacterium sp. 0TCS1.6C]MCX8295748.1 TetR/AcrR family transcriptional regulator [Phyllobacterium sp. 0TCS1.6A]